MGVTGRVRPVIGSLRESRRGRAPPVPEVDDLREGLRLDEFEVESLRQWREVRGTATQHDGTDEQPVLIDEVFLGKGGGEPGIVSVGGARLAASLAEKDLIDEYRLFVSPVVLGGGTPYFPPLPKRLDLELIETQTFSQVVYLRYRRS